MATKKKYDNGEGVKRYHYDVYELLGDEAYHIAPFTNETEAIRCAEAYAALAYVDREHFDIYNWTGEATLQSFVVRARATKDHNIFRHGSKDINRAVKTFGNLKNELANFLTSDTSGPYWEDVSPEEVKISPEVKIHVEGPKTKGKRKTKA